MRRIDPLTVLLAIGGVLYPFLVFFALPHVSPAPLVLFAIALGGLHLLRHKDYGSRIMSQWGIALILCVILVLLAVRPILAAQAYPPLVSLSLAATFAGSLLHPPSAIERIARLTTPDLSPEAIAYTRGLTKIWMVFFLANASIACICSLWFTVEVWTLWTGLISYLLIGALFAGEIVVRRLRLRRALP